VVQLGSYTFINTPFYLLILTKSRTENLCFGNIFGILYTYFKKNLYIFCADIYRFNFNCSVVRIIVLIYEVVDVMNPHMYTPHTKYFPHTIF